MTDAAIRHLMVSTDAACVRADCEVALGLVLPRAFDTVDRARQRCLDEIASIAAHVAKREAQLAADRALAKRQLLNWVNRTAR